MAEKKRKYLLFTKADGRTDAQKPCAFFISEAGCRNGAQCQFSHGNDAPTLAKPTPIPKPVIYKEEKVEVKVVKKVVKNVEPVPVAEPIREVIRTPKPVVREPKVEKKVAVKSASVAREYPAASVATPVAQSQNSNQMDSNAVMNALDAQKRQFELQLKMQEELFLQQQRSMQQQMMKQNMDAEKVRQQEQYQMEEDRKQAAFNARQAKAQQPIVKEDRRLQNEKNKRRKSNDSTPIPVQQSHSQPQQTMAPVRTNGSKTTPSVRTQIREMALSYSTIFEVQILSLQYVVNEIIL
jgi:uncharacterized protein YcfJ